MGRWSIAAVRQRQDLLFASLLVIGTTITWAVVPTTHSSVGVGALALNVVGAAALIWRRRAPVLVPLLAYTAVAASFFVQAGIPVFSQLIIYIAGYTTISAARSIVSIVIRVGACVAAVTLVIALTINDVLLAFVEAVAIVGALTAVTLLARNASAEKRRLATDAERASAEAERREQEAVAAERNRIARDLHDAVTHSITVSILQARGGRKVLDRDPSSARTAFDTIESISEQALIEMRRMLGVLRNGAGAVNDTSVADGGFATPPTLRQLDQLLGTVPSAITVDTDVSGDLTILPPSVDTTAFRILQEALTNMIKHSDARRLAVTVTVQPDALTLRVQNDGVPHPGAGPAGFGIIGMRERVAAFGGNFTARAQPGSGFLVTARLPLQEQV
jgi:signal transduction histidine kinase